MTSSPHSVVLHSMLPPLARARIPPPPPSPPPPPTTGLWSGQNQYYQQPCDVVGDGSEMMPVNSRPAMNTSGFILPQVESQYPTATLKCPRRSTSCSGSSTIPLGRSPQFYKTRMCPWFFKQCCDLGSKCRFAHSVEELRRPPDLSRTSLCPRLVKEGVCHMTNCSYAHSHAELRATDEFFKVSLCYMWQKGRCALGSKCRHAHGIDELRTKTLNRTPLKTTSDPSGFKHVPKQPPPPPPPRDSHPPAPMAATHKGRKENVDSFTPYFDQESVFFSKKAEVQDAYRSFDPRSSLSSTVNSLSVGLDDELLSSSLSASLANDALGDATESSPATTYSQPSEIDHILTSHSAENVTATGVTDCATLLLLAAALLVANAGTAATTTNPAEFDCAIRKEVVSPPLTQPHELLSSNTAPQTKVPSCGCRTEASTFPCKSKGITPGPKDIDLLDDDKSSSLIYDLLGISLQDVTTDLSDATPLQSSPSLKQTNIPALISSLSSAETILPAALQSTHMKYQWAWDG